jgi:protein-tyrosine phosphatase
MQTKVVKLDDKKIDIGKIKEAAELVDSGGLVAFPTETVYGIACRVQNDSLIRLGNLKGREPDGYGSATGKYYTLHIGQKADVKKYVPVIGLKATKLIEKCWPGPLTVVFELDDEGIKNQRINLKKQVFEGLYKDNSIGIRCPDNPIAAILLQGTRSPVVAPSANLTGQPPAIAADEVLAQFSGQIEMILDAGPCKYKKSSTVVKIGKNGLEILRDGAYSREDLEAMSMIKFFFVCTGNTCRSPMAEGIFRKYLAEKLQSTVDELDRIGYKVYSAGVIDMSGMPASPEAIAACTAKGIDIKAHKSRALSRQLIDESDFIFVMAEMHRERVIGLSPESADKCVLLAEKDIPDPIGQPQEVYNACAEQIEEAVRRRIDELVI